MTASTAKALALAVAIQALAPFDSARAHVQHLSADLVEVLQAQLQEVTHGAAGERPGLGEQKETERANTRQSHVEVAGAGAPLERRSDGVTAGRDPLSTQDRQVPLFGNPDRARIVAAHDPDEPVGAPDHRRDEPSHTYGDPTPLARDHSSSSDLDPTLFEEKKKTDRGVTLDADQPVTEWGRRIHAQVAAARPDLPPLDFVWSSFVDFVVDKGKHYRTMSGLQRRYRSFLRWEKPLLFEAAAAADVAPASGVADLAPDLARERQARIATSKQAPELAFLASGVGALFAAVAGPGVARAADPKREAVAC